VREHEAERGTGMRGEHGADGGMALEVEIGAERLVDLGARQRGGRGIGAAFAKPFRLAAGDIAFVEDDLAGAAHVDVDASALAPRAFLMLPALERRVGAKDDDLLPSRRAVRVGAGGDGGVLRGPERVGIGEPARFPEQVFGNREAARIDIEQRVIGGNGRAAEEPCPQALAGGGVAVRVIETRKPCLLLALGGKGEVADARSVDVAAPVEAAEARQQVAEREDAADGAVRKPERRGDVGGRAAFAGKAHEGFPLGDLVGVEPGEVLDEGGLDGGVIVAVVDDRAG
jgi:hypothetical protein